MTVLVANETWILFFLQKHTQKARVLIIRPMAVQSLGIWCDRVVIPPEHGRKDALLWQHYLAQQFTTKWKVYQLLL